MIDEKSDTVFGVSKYFKIMKIFIIHADTVLEYERVS